MRMRRGASTHLHVPRPTCQNEERLTSSKQNIRLQWDTYALCFTEKSVNTWGWQRASGRGKWWRLRWGQLLCIRMTSQVVLSTSSKGTIHNKKVCKTTPTATVLYALEQQKQAFILCVAPYWHTYFLNVINSQARTSWHLTEFHCSEPRPWPSKACQRVPRITTLQQNAWKWTRSRLQTASVLLYSPNLFLKNRTIKLFCSTLLFFSNHKQNVPMS